MVSLEWNRCWSWNMTMLCATRCTTAHGGSFEVIEHATDAQPWLLAASPDGVVVLCGNQDADHHLSAAFFARW